MNQDDIHPYILLIADALDRNVSEQDIIDASAINVSSTDDIFLILAAAKLLHKDRKMAPPRKTLIKRSM